MSRADAASDTIAAIATGVAPGAIGIIRISGPKTLAILDAITQKKLDFARQPRKQIYCRIIEAGGEELDDGLLSFFPGPHSYTGEDSAELGLHGNPILLRRVLACILQTGLCRPAGPGEFSKRAYLNGRLDLTQAEAVHSIVTARSELELSAARKNLYGELSRLMSRFRSALIHIKAETEAAVDFSTEDLSFETKESRVRCIEDLLLQIGGLLKRGEETARLRSGFQVALVGVPNVGKSSLLNALLGWERAIVSPQAGTTRDFLSAELNLDGLTVNFVDTAGLHETADAIEKEGIRMSLRSLKESQLVLHLIDAEQFPYKLPSLAKEIDSKGTDIKILYVVNKMDLVSSSWEKKEALLQKFLPYPTKETQSQKYAEAIKEKDVTKISCKTGEGISELKEQIRRELIGGSPPEPLLLEDRHRFHFQEIEKALRRVLELWKTNAPEEIVAIELDLALEHTGRMTGRIDNEEILGRIFSVFCVGK